MSQRITTTLIDDISGDEIAAGTGRTVHFGIDGSTYEIDLVDEHVDALREAFSDYIAAGRKVGGPRAVKTAATTAKPGRSNPDDLAKIREWASAKGYEVSNRGRIAGTVREAYAAAH